MATNNTSQAVVRKKSLPEDTTGTSLNQVRNRFKAGRPKRKKSVAGKQPSVSVDQAAQILQQQREAENEIIRREVIENNRLDILCKFVLGYDIEDVHAQIINFQNTHDKGMVLIGRGFGKTTVGTVARAIHEIIKNRDIRILLASKTRGNTQGFLREIKNHLFQNERLIEIFGSFYDDRIWNEYEIIVAGRRAAHKEPTISTVGADSAIASRHYDLIICDDVVDEVNSRTETQRKRIKNLFFTTIVPTLEPDGRLWILGTRYHPFDLYGELLGEEDDPGEYYHKLLHLKSLIEDPTTGTERSLWEIKFSTSYLKQLRRSMGTIIFNAQYQNDIEIMKGEIFQWDWFKEYNPIPKGARLEDKKTSWRWDECRIFQGVDLAIGQDDNSDFFAHVTVAITPEGDILVRDVVEKRMTFAAQKRFLKKKHAQFDPLRVGIEKNGYQKALILDMREDPKLRAIRALGILTNRNKALRAHKLSAYFESGRVYFAKGMDWVKKHILEVPNGKHDDVFDAMDIAISLGLSAARVKTTRRKEPKVIRG